MARITGIEYGGSLISRLAFFFTRRRVGRVSRPVRITALNILLLKGYGRMEAAQKKATNVPAPLKRLGQVRVAMLVGCPF